MVPGDDMVGLAVYLAGPGRANEHENPHLVAGSDRLMSWYSNDTLTHADALDIGAELDQTHRVLGVEINGGHVRHISLSLHHEDGVKTDEEWEAIATDFMKGMGYIGVEGKADVPWAAVHHGLSGVNGNDHIHLAVSLVREDGTRASTWLDYDKTQDVSREMEAKYRLVRVVPGHGAPGYGPAEVYAAERRGRLEPERATLARMVRGYASASESEAEFVRRMRRGGLLVKPRFEDGGQDKVVGYAVALKPPKGYRPLFYAASKVARDLGLRVVRERWEGFPSDTEALAEWQAARYGKRMVNPHGRDSLDVDTDTMERAADQLEKLRVHLRSVPFENAEEWRRVASFLSGAYASWSVATEPVPGDLARVADELAKTAQVSKSAYRKHPVAMPMGLYSATALAVAAQSGGVGAQLAVFVQMSKLARTVHEFNKYRRDQVREMSMMRNAAGALDTVSTRLHEAAGVPVPKPKTKARGVAPVQTRSDVVGPRLEARQNQGHKARR